METLGFLTAQSGTSTILSRYDSEADVLYLSAGDPKPAIGVDIGEGIVLRYDPVHEDIVGITVIGLMARFQAEFQG